MRLCRCVKAWLLRLVSEFLLSFSVSSPVNSSNVLLPSDASRLLVSNLQCNTVTTSYSYVATLDNCHHSVNERRNDELECTHNCYMCSVLSLSER